MDEKISQILDLVKELQHKVQSLENVCTVNQELIQANIELNKIAKVQEIAPLPELKVETKFKIRCVPLGNSVLLLGQTFDVKEKLKQVAGATWHASENKNTKGWLVSKASIASMQSELKNLCEFDTSELQADDEDMAVDQVQIDSLDANNVFTFN